MTELSLVKLPKGDVTESHWWLVTMSLLIEAWWCINVWLNWVMTISVNGLKLDMINTGLLWIGPLGINFSEILIKIEKNSYKKIDLKLSSAKWQSFRLCFAVLIHESHRWPLSPFLFHIYSFIYLLFIHKWKLVCQKQVSRAGKSNYFPQHLLDVITCPWPWYLFLAHDSTIMHVRTVQQTLLDHLTPRAPFIALFNQYWAMNK